MFFAVLIFQKHNAIPIIFSSVAEIGVVICVLFSITNVTTTLDQ